MSGPIRVVKLYNDGVVKAVTFAYHLLMSFVSSLAGVLVLYELRSFKTHIYRTTAH